MWRRIFCGGGIFPKKLKISLFWMWSKHGAEPTTHSHIPSWQCCRRRWRRRRDRGIVWGRRASRVVVSWVRCFLHFWSWSICRAGGQCWPSGVNLRTVWKCSWWWWRWYYCCACFVVSCCIVVFGGDLVVSSTVVSSLVAVVVFLSFGCFFFRDLLRKAWQKLQLAYFYANERTRQCIMIPNKLRSGVTKRIFINKYLSVHDSTWSLMTTHHHPSSLTSYHS